MLPQPVRKTRDLWAAALVGVVATGVISALLEAGGLTPPISDGAGAFVGGAAAAYFLYGDMRLATAAGALSGVLGLPFYVGMSDILVIVGIIPMPTQANPPLPQLQLALAVILGVNLVAGMFGGTVMGAVRHPREQPPISMPQTVPGSIPQNKYCIQCGAQLPAGAVVCPHCNARQP